MGIKLDVERGWRSTAECELEDSLTINEPDHYEPAPEPPAPVKNSGIGGYTGNSPHDTIKVVLDNGYVLPKADVARSLEALKALIPQIEDSHPKPTPAIGRIVHYTLTDQGAETINRRRDDARFNRHGITPNGEQVHVGNPVHAGDVFPLIITRVWGGDLINGQVLLDGNDTYWATSVHEGEGGHQYQWPNTAPKTEVSK